MTWRTLFLYSAAFAAFALAYQIAGGEPSRPAQLLFSFGPAAGVAVWVDADARRRRRSPCWEIGTFVFFAWPVAVPAYCLWSRGRGGWGILGGLLAALVAPSLLATLLWSLYRALGV